MFELHVDIYLYISYTCIMASYDDPAKIRFKELILENGGHHGIAQDEYKREQIPENKRCDNCGGTGNQLYAMYQECEECKGDGRLNG